MAKRKNSASAPLTAKKSFTSKQKKHRVLNSDEELDSEVESQMLKLLPPASEESEEAVEQEEYWGVPAGEEGSDDDCDFEMKKVEKAHEDELSDSDFPDNDEPAFEVEEEFQQEQDNYSQEVQEELDDEPEEEAEENENDKPVGPVKEKLPRKTVRSEQKKTMEERKAAADKNFAIVQQSKKIWETLRKKDLKDDERKRSLTHLLKITKGKVAALIFKHDSVRVFQSALKYGDANIRNAIADELKGHWLELAKSKYAKFLLLAILKYCPKVRPMVFEEWKGHIKTLARHREASMILNDAYVLYCTSKQKYGMIQEFYGPEFKHFKHEESISILMTKEDKKKSILEQLSKHINDFIAKELMDSEIAHRLLKEYLQFAEPNAISEIIDAISPLFAHLVHSNDGAYACLLAIAHATAKQRKLIIKSVKDFACKTAQEQYGHLVVIALFAATDDTVYTAKALLTELYKELPVLLTDRYASRVFLFLLTDLKFSSCDKERWDEFNKIIATTAKKDISTKKAELKDGLIEAIESVKSMESLATCQSSVSFLGSYLTTVKTDSVLFDSILKYLNKIEACEKHPLVTNQFTATFAKHLLPIQSFATQFFDLIVKPSIAFWANNSHTTFLVLSLARNEWTTQVVKKALKKATVTVEVKTADLLRAELNK